MRKSNLRSYSAILWAFCTLYQIFPVTPGQLLALQIPKNQIWNSQKNVVLLCFDLNLDAQNLLTFKEKCILWHDKYWNAINKVFFEVHFYQNSFKSLTEFVFKILNLNSPWFSNPVFSFLFFQTIWQGHENQIWKYKKFGPVLIQILMPKILLTLKERCNL